MTMLRPAESPGLVTRLLESVSLKTCLAVALSVTAWHYTDAGAINSLKEHSAEQDRRFDVQREATQRKLDRETYMADQQQMHQDIHDIRVSEDDIKQLLMARSLTEVHP